MIDYRKIDTNLIPLMPVIFVSIYESMLVRLAFLENGYDTGTANLIFLIIFGIFATGYIVSIKTFEHIISPLLKPLVLLLFRFIAKLLLRLQIIAKSLPIFQIIAKLLPKKNKSIPAVIEDNNTVSNEEEVVLEKPTEDINQNVDINYLIKSDKKKRGRKKVRIPLTAMLSKTSVNKPDDIIERIGKYLMVNNGQKDIAILKVALEELKYIKTYYKTTFRDALVKQYGDAIEFKGIRGVQRALENPDDFYERPGVFQKNVFENREKIENLKKILSF